MYYERNAEALIVASKETGLEVSAERTMYMVMTQEQRAAPNHNTEVDNTPFQRVEQFKYVGTTLTNQHSNHEEIKNQLK
jgi:hypothetical protein